MRDLDDLEKKIREAEHGKAPTPEEIRKETDDENARAGIHAGMELVASILVAGVIGYYLDQWLGTAPGFFLGMLFLGICTGFYNVWRITEKIGTSVGISRLHHESKDAKTAPDHGESVEKPPENDNTERE